MAALNSFEMFSSTLFDKMGYRFAPGLCLTDDGFISLLYRLGDQFDIVRDFFVKVENLLFTGIGYL